MRASMISAAFVAALVGFGSTVALVLAAAQALQATPGQTASWVLAIAVAKGIGSLGLSWRHRVPVVLAWSTPGAALIAASEGVTMPEAVAAFLLAAGLIALTGALKPLGALVARIPDGIAAGMLAGVLLPFCLKGALAAKGLPGVVLPMVAVFVLARLRSPAWTVLAALATGLALGFGLGLAHLPAGELVLPRPEFIAPEIRWDVLVGLGLPLYLVTMASQNLPGFAVMRAAGYEPPVRSALAVTGGLSGLSALFGAHPINMAAITAAICMGPDVHPDPKERWRVGVIYGLVWVGLGLVSPLVIAVLQALPVDLLAAIVGLALLSPLTGALAGAFTPERTRFAAAMTLAVTASGVAAFGVGAAFWGLLAGLALQGLERFRRF